MPGSNRLQTTIMQLNGDLTSKQKMAESLQNSAKIHADTGDEVKAKTDQESAERYLEDVKNIEAQIASMQTLMFVKDQKVKKIEDQMQDITNNFEKEMSKLKSERDSLV